MTLAVEQDESNASRIFNAVRANTAQHVSQFLRTPLAWVLIAGIVFFSAWHAYLREGNRFACAATSTTIDTQIFRELIAGDGLGGGVAFRRACAGMSEPGPNWSRYASGKGNPFFAILSPGR